MKKYFIILLLFAKSAFCQNYFWTYAGTGYPIVITSSITNIAATYATGGGTVTSDNGQSVTDRGVCWSTASNPTISNSHTHDGSGTGTFTSSITGLTENSTYYVRAYAVNGSGTSYGDNVTFTAVNGGYGKLYNFYALAGDSIAASGWHVPTDTEWTTLTDYLGGLTVAGGKLKETGTVYWASPNTGATNEAGFYGRGAGRKMAGFDLLKSRGSFWCATAKDATNGWDRYIYQVSATCTRDWGTKSNGYSVRLIKDDSNLTDYTGNDGKLYTAVKIGNQVWIASNLRETKYRKGTTIPNVTDGTWTTLTTGAYCWYNNNPGYE